MTLPADKAGVIEALAALHPAERPAVERFLGLVHGVTEQWISFTDGGGPTMRPDAARCGVPAVHALREVLDELFVNQTLKTVLAAY